MIPATLPVQRAADARLLVVESQGQISEMFRSSFPTLLQPGDIVVANDAATLPASISGFHEHSGRPIEVRLAGHESEFQDEPRQFLAVVFGEGSYHTPTERRPNPPDLCPGDALLLGPLKATILETLGHPRLVMIRFEGSEASFWEGLARNGHPIQYSHISTPLALWDTWTAIAGPPVAFEPPSAGFVLDWRTIDAIRRRGAQFATITHAAGISSTGDEKLDARLPFDEPYRIPGSTARLIERARAAGGRVIAIGTTVVRALEHAASLGGIVHERAGLAVNKIGPATELKAVDAILSGVHEPGSSHHNLLNAFVERETLKKMDETLQRNRYRMHEFGDSVFIEKSRHSRSWNASCTQCGTQYVGDSL